jgi:hypothetical protein
MASSSSSKSSLGTGLGLAGVAATTVTLTALVYLNGTNQSGTNQSSQYSQNTNGNAPVPVVPETNAGWVLVPFFGAFLLFSARQLFGPRGFRQKNENTNLDPPS